MTTDTARANLHARDKKIVETSVPAHMLILMLEKCQEIGFECRLDVLRHLNNAAAAPLTKIDLFSVSRLAKRIDEVGTTLLNDLAPDDPRAGLYAVCMFVTKLVEEGRFPDVTNQAVLCSMLFLDDVKDDRPDESGQGVVWRLKLKKWEQEAGRMLSRANLMGLYLKDGLQLSA
jgi:hypothetical protein